VDSLQSWGLDLVRALQQFSPGLDGLMRFFSFLGEEDFFSVLVAFVYWCVNAAIGMRLLTLLVLSDFVNALFKWGFHAPRPYWVDARVKAMSVEPSYGLPSGHAQTGTAVWRFLAHVMTRPWARAAAVALVLSVSISRVYLGVHFPHDVVAGWVIGAALLAVFLWAEPRLARRLATVSLVAQIATALLVSLVMVGLVLGVRAAIAGVPDPPGWAERATAASSLAPGKPPFDTRNADGPLADAGIALGAGAGLALRRRFVSFDARGPWSRRIARLVLGLVVLVALRVGLAVVFPQEPLAAGMVFRVVRYAIMALWLVWLAPLVFVRLNLARATP